MKLFIPCTPTIAKTSIVWKWWLLTDQRQFVVPCPHCGAFQKLEWERLIWPKGNPEKCEYVCQACDSGFREHLKPSFIPEGRFEATAIAQRRLAVGMTVSSMYAPLGSYSWIQMASQFEAAGNRESELKTFFNIRLGLPWRQTSDAPTADQLEGNKEPLAPMTLPDRCLAITAGGDVQGDRVEIYVWGWGRGLESWLLGKYIIDRFKARAEGDVVIRDPRPLQEIASEINSKVTQALWTRADGAKMGMQFGLMDVNFDTTWAWRLIQALGPRWGAVRGAGGAGEDQGGAKATRLLTVSKVEREKVKNLTLYRVSSPLAFSEFYRFLRQPRPDGEQGTWEGFVHLPDDVDDEVLQQLTADQEVYDSKKKKLVWVKTRDRNEAGDCRKYARAALEAKKIASWTSAQWAAREAALKADAERRLAEAEATAAAVKKNEPPPKKRAVAIRTKSPLVSGGD
jgi:phage terminase large subunit GpA-like protein